MHRFVKTTIAEPPRVLGETRLIRRPHPSPPPLPASPKPNLLPFDLHSRMVCVGGMILRLAHLCLHTDHLDRLIAFYRDTLGLPVKFRFAAADGSVFGAYIALGDTTFVEFFDQRGANFQWGDPTADLAPLVSGSRYNHFALEVADLAATRPDGTKLFTPLVCLNLMVFYVFAMQCISTIAVVKRETNTWRWPLFQLAYMTGTSWAVCFVVYQVGRALGF